MQESLKSNSLNDIIIQMLLHGAVNDKPNFVDPGIDRNYQKGFEIAPQPPTEFSPSYIEPFRQRPPQMEKWWGRKG